MEIFERLLAIFRPRMPGPDEVAIRYTQAMLNGDAETVLRMSEGAGLQLSRETVAKFAEAKLARWFGRLRALDAPPAAVPPPIPPVRRYVVGRVALPENATQDFPILAVGLVRTKRRWAVVSVRPNAALFDDGTADPPLPSEVIQLDDELLTERG
ncbi:MAG: hypothetical protein RMM58_04610 [Chloroflexota bacterium]|nr:hypothetical protein [Dehalococcoidia bacterium]MDW8253144.1 hypothetical protein [Chloroflexota bacterium]